MKTIVKNITTKLLLSVVLFSSVLFVQAQQGGQRGGQGGPPPMPDEDQIEQMVADLSKELSLTDSQEKNVSAAYFTHFEEASELKDGNARPDREVMEKLRDDFETEVKSYLDKDQQKQFDKYQEKQQSNRGGQGGPPR